MALSPRADRRPQQEVSEILRLAPALESRVGCRYTLSWLSGPRSLWAISVLRWRTATLARRTGNLPRSMHPWSCLVCRNGTLMIDATAPAPILVLAPRLTLVPPVGIVPLNGSCGFEDMCLRMAASRCRVASITRRQRAAGSRAALRSGPLPFSGMGMRTRIYVDGFNLYYGALKGTPFKWLDPVRLTALLLPRECVIDRLRYFTARVSGKLDRRAPARQQIYLKALSTLPEVSIHYGRFLAKTAWRPLANLPVAGRRIDAPRPVTLPRGDHRVHGDRHRTLPVGVYPDRHGGRQGRARAGAGCRSATR